MKVRINIDRLVLHSQPMSRRERAALHDEIAREVNRVLDPRSGGARPENGARGSIAQQVAFAINTQLPRQTGQRR